MGPLRDTLTNYLIPTRSYQFLLFQPRGHAAALRQQSRDREMLDSILSGFILADKLIIMADSNRVGNERSLYLLLGKKVVCEPNKSQL